VFLQGLYMYQTDSFTFENELDLLFAELPASSFAKILLLFPYL